MSLTITITDSLQLAGVAAMNAARAGEPMSDEAYLQSQVEAVCLGYASAFRIGVVSSGDFVLRFTAQEFYDINVASQTDAVISGFLARIREVGNVTLYSEETRLGMAYLVGQGLVTAERAEEILSWATPAAPEPEPAPPVEPTEPEPEVQNASAPEVQNASAPEVTE